MWERAIKQVRPTWAFVLTLGLTIDLGTDDPLYDDAWWIRRAYKEGDLGSSSGLTLDRLGIGFSSRLEHAEG